MTLRCCCISVIPLNRGGLVIQQCWCHVDFSPSPSLNIIPPPTVSLRLGFSFIRILLICTAVDAAAKTSEALTFVIAGKDALKSLLVKSSKCKGTTSISIIYPLLKSLLALLKCFFDFQFPLNPHVRYHIKFSTSPSSDCRLHTLLRYSTA